jgi:Ran GTPase-activating protein (RanGAP) involved in mRNA processing and transport
MLNKPKNNPNVSNTSLEQTIKLIKQNSPDVSALDLSRQPFTDTQMRRLCRALKNNTHIKRINFSFCRINEKRAAYIAAMLQKNRSIIELNLGYNNIGDRGIKVLSKALIPSPPKHPTPSLTIINLTNNNIGDEGIAYFADVIASNKALKHIILQENKVGDRGAKFLADKINKKCELASLNLVANHITDKGKNELVTALKESGLSPELIDVKGNVFSANIIKEVIGNISDEQSRNLLLRLYESKPHANATITIDCNCEQVSVVQGRDIDFYQLLFTVLLQDKKHIKNMVISKLDEKHPLYQQILKYLIFGLTNNPNIEYIRFSNCFIDDKAAEQLQKFFCLNTSIKTFELVNTNISEQGAKYLASALESNCHLTALTVRGFEAEALDTKNPINLNLISFIINTLEKNKSIQNLSLPLFLHIWKTRLLEILKKNTNIKSLLISDPDLIASVIEANIPHIKELKVYTIIAFTNHQEFDRTNKAIAINSSIKTLNFLVGRPRDIDPSAMTNIGKNPNIHTLSIKFFTAITPSDCEIGCEHIAKIFSSKESKIKHFKIYDCALGWDSMKSLLDPIIENKTLEVLELDGCAFYGDAKDKLVQCLEQNKSFPNVIISQRLNLLPRFLGKKAIKLHGEVVEYLFKQDIPLDAHVAFHFTREFEDGMIIYSEKTKLSRGALYRRVLSSLVQLRSPIHKHPLTGSPIYDSQKHTNVTTIAPENASQILLYLPNFTKNPSILFQEAQKISAEIFSRNEKYLEIFARNVKAILLQVQVCLKTQQKIYNEAKGKNESQNDIATSLKAILEILKDAQKSCASLLQEGLFQTNTIIKDTINTLKLPINELVEAMRIIGENAPKQEKNTVPQELRKLHTLVNNLKQLSAAPAQLIEKQQSFIKKMGLV